MSPEQAVGGTATAASDRYGLAVVAFELLCGRRPYLAETFAAEAAAHATAPIPAATGFDRSLPPPIDAVLERALAKDPAARYRSCGELVANLRSAFADSAGTTVRMVGAAAPTAATVVAPPRTRHASQTIGARDRHRCCAWCAGAPRHRPRGGVVDGGGDALPPTTVVRTATVAGRAAGPHRDGRGAARDASAPRARAPPSPSPRRPPRADPPSTTRGSGCSRPATRRRACRFSSVRWPRCRAPAR